MDEVLIFDGDDTLWSTEQLYDDARASARAIVESYGFDGPRWEATERARDVANVARLGMTAGRFPTSCVEALADVVPGGAEAVPPQLCELIWNAAAKVFETPAQSMPGAADVLTALAPRHAIVLLTKGDPAIQARRIASSGLAPLLDRVEVVDEKRPALFRELAQSLGVATSNAVSIGNSLRSDILPAVEAGMRGVWIDAHVWEYERVRSDEAVLPDGVVVAHSILEVPAILDGLLAWR